MLFSLASTESSTSPATATATSSGHRARRPYYISASYNNPNNPFFNIFHDFHNTFSRITARAT